MATTLSVRTARPVTASASLSPALAFPLLASIVIAFLAGSSAPTPLYALYQAAWGFSPITITVIFGVYALAVLAALLTVGSLSDYVGRRPVLLVAIAMQMVTMVIFATASSVNALLAARIVQGLSAGAAVGAIGAGMLDIDRARGTIANSVAPMIGMASGGLLSGLMVHFLPAPKQLVYLFLLGVFVVQAIGVYRMAETSPPRPGALASLRPHFRLPVETRQRVLLAVPLLVAAWALAGFYGSLGPTLVRRVASSSSMLLGGVALFSLGVSGAITVLLLRARSSRTLMMVGATGLASGVLLTFLAMERSSVAIFFVGTVVSGAGFGTGFQGAIRDVVPLAPPDARAGLLSVLFLISYLAMGLPAVLAGVRVVHGGGVVRTTHEYGAVVILLASAALLGTLVRARTEKRS